MPTYPYFCEYCDQTVDVVKSVSAIEDVESCECGGIMERRIGKTAFIGGGDWTPTFNPALGCVVRSRAHQREILSQRKGEGRELIEVGNEPVENLHKHYDQQRETARLERWNEPTEKVLAEALK